MEISKDDLLTFTKEEKKEIDAALNNVLDDLDELWKHSSKQEVYTYFYMRRSDWDEEMIRLSIDQEGIKLGDDPEYILEQFKTSKQGEKKCKKFQKWAYGEIGRRAGFRFQWGNPSEFESLYAHHLQHFLRV